MVLRVPAKQFPNCIDHSVGCKKYMIAITYSIENLFLHLMTYFWITFAYQLLRRRISHRADHIVW